MKGTRWVLRREGRSNPPDLSDVILCKTLEDAKDIYGLLNEYLKDRGLTLAPDKTHITHIKEGFNFLGYVRRARGFIPHTVSVKQFVSIPVALGFSPMKLLIE